MPTDLLGGVRSEDLLDALPDSLFVLDSEGRIAFVNRRGREVTGFHREDIEGLHYGALVSLVGDTGDFRELGDAVEATLGGETTRARRGELPIDSPDLGRFETEFQLSAVTDEGGDVVGAVVTMRDISERKAYERSLEESSEKLAILNRLLRHDIRNDLNVVAGWAQELRRHVDEDGEEVLDRLLSATNHSVELTRESRDLVEALERGTKLDLVAVDAVNTLTQEVTKAESRFPDAEFEGPDRRDGLRVTANELLSSVFANLLNNAVIHNDADDPRVRVDVEEDEEMARITVADNGPGIDPQQRERLFEREEQGLESPGTGMGLYLVRYLVSEYGGSVSVRESDMGGAAFTVELPRSG